MADTGQSESPENTHPTFADKVAAALIALLWVALAGGENILRGVGTLLAGNNGDPVGTGAALTGVFFAGVLIYALLLKAIGWYHGV